MPTPRPSLDRNPGTRRDTPTPPSHPTPPGHRPSPKRGLLGWLMILVGLTLLAGATTCMVQTIQCTCPGRIHCEDVPRDKRKYPCLQQELGIIYTNIKQKITDLMTPKKPVEKEC